jgi:hypothetical protein
MTVERFGIVTDNHTTEYHQFLVIAGNALTIKGIYQVHPLSQRYPPAGG